MMQAGVRLRQDTETTQPELPEQHRIREKEEELHGLESVHMAESEIKCTAPGPKKMEPECVTANSRVSDLHHTEASLIKTETDLGSTCSGGLKMESLDLAELACVTHLYPDQVKMEVDVKDHIKTEHVSVVPDIKCVDIKSDELKQESSEVLVSDLMKTVLNGAGVNINGQTGPCQYPVEPNPISAKQTNLIQDVGIRFSENLHQCSHLNNLKRVPPTEKPYKCDQCEKSFAWKSHFKSHQRIHTGEKPYKCEQCGKSFASKSTLKFHQYVHTDEKPYKCDQCERSFAWKSHLKCHKSIHTGEKPFKCDWCEKSFAWKSQLKYHQSIHTSEKPLKCDRCEKSFAWKWHLKCHQSTHTSEKPLKCDRCEKSFAQKSHLKCHQRIHTGE
ncbi:hypothetical protein GJAV_G00087840, partial [Gymnothorax javanicus]